MNLDGHDITETSMFFNLDDKSSSSCEGPKFMSVEDWERNQRVVAAGGVEIFHPTARGRIEREPQEQIPQAAVGEMERSSISSQAPLRKKQWNQCAIAPRLSKKESLWKEKKKKKRGKKKRKKKKKMKKTKKKYAARPAVAAHQASKESLCWCKAKSSGKERLRKGVRRVARGQGTRQAAPRANPRRVPPSDRLTRSRN